jgi:predicted amidohydrolase
MIRIALANLRFPETPEHSVSLATRAISEAGSAGATILCFPEEFVPGYRQGAQPIEPHDPDFLQRAVTTLSTAARDSNITVILGTERLVDGRLRISSVVLNPDGTIQGEQDKVQLDPSEDSHFSPGVDRQIFQAGELIFGIAICHEGWRYPETVRATASLGAHVVFHPHYARAESGSYAPRTFADPANTFHEKALLCRAAENTCYIASVNYASEGSPTTSCVVNPDGTLLTYQPYGVEGLLLADIDPEAATGLLARRYKPAQQSVLPLANRS